MLEKQLKMKGDNIFDDDIKSHNHEIGDPNYNGPGDDNCNT